MVSNHVSYLDTVYFYALTCDEFVFLGKGELLKWPLFRLFFRTTDIPVHRGSPAKAAQAMKLAARALNEGKCLAIYPEGTIPHSAPRLSRFKNGAFRLAAETGVPIVPVTWTTNHQIIKDPLPLWLPTFPQKARAIIYKPIIPQGAENPDILHLRDMTFKVIESALSEYEQHRNKK
jgi:1-acyl-sn-glycerol-3-phosphate acyltransferase